MKSEHQGGRMSDPIRLPASTITPDVETVMDAEPYPPVDWERGGTIEERIDSAMKAKLWALFSGVGEPHE